MICQGGRQLATSVVNAFVQHLHRSERVRDGEGRTDGQLLDFFIDQKDEAAFETLVLRHGPMVLGVCRGIVRNHHDAEDAFQTTFLILARKASSVMPRQMVANWLHGVAYRTAKKAMTRRAKLQKREKNALAMPEPEVTQKEPLDDLRLLLDQELRGLPEQLRFPIVLCDLEGRSIKEATQQLGWPQGTLAGRLFRGRQLLAKRLSKRGVALSGGLLGEMLFENATLAKVPASLLASTVRAGCKLMAGLSAAEWAVSNNVSLLMEEVMTSMMLTKFKAVMAALLAVGLFSFGGGFLTLRTAAQEVEPGKPLTCGEEAGKPQAQAKAPAPGNASDEQKPERASGASPITPSYVVMSPDVLLVEVDGLSKEPILKEVQCVVRTDGTISLGAYGTVPVADLALEKIPAAIAAKLAQQIGTDAKLDVRVNVISYNSRVYYVIATGGENETVIRSVCTGGDTVVSAVLQAGLAVNAIKGRVFVRALPSRNILEVDWCAITQKGKTETNYVLQPGDRVYVQNPIPKDTSRVPPVESKR